MKTIAQTLFIHTAFIALVGGFAISAHAEGASAQFGLVYGSSVADADNTTPYWMTGVRGTAYVFPSLSVGGYYYWSDTSGEPSSAEAFRYSLHGAEVAYHLVAGAGEVLIALRGGFSKVETKESGNKITYSPYHLGIATGYDYFLLPSVSVGFEGSLTHVKKGYTTDNGTDYDLDAFNIMSFLVSLQFRM